jgi:Sulfatase
MDFDARLEALRDRFSIRARRSRHNRVQAAVLQRWSAIPDEAPVLLWGDEEHTAELLDLVGSGTKNVVAVADAAAAPDVAGRKISLIVISSFRHRAEIRTRAEERFPGCAVLDFYDELESNPDYAGHAGYPFYSGSEYVKIFELRQAYEREREPYAKAGLLFELLAAYFEIRDFVHGAKYAGEYVSRGYDKGGEVAGFATAAQALLDELKQSLRARTGDVALFLVDALRMKDVRPEGGAAAPMPFLRAFSREALTFSNAFSSSLYTLPSVPSMLTGKLPLDDLIFKQRVVRVDESPLLSELHGRGYTLYNYISWKDFFAGDSRVIPVQMKASGDGAPHLSRAVAPRMLWNFAARVAADRGATFSLLHLFYETHDPHLCGHHAQPPVQHLFYEYLGNARPGITGEDYRRQYLECLSYMDGQLAFYFDLLPAAMVKAVFGDHGQIAERILEHPEEVGSLLSWHDDRIRVALMVKAPALAGRTQEGLFSMADLGPLVLGAVDGTVTVKARSCVPVQFDPLYSKKLRAVFASAGCQKYAKGFKLLRGERDKYVLYHDGAEEYYVLPDERNDRLDAPEHAAAIAALKSQMKDTTFPDFGIE